MRKPDTPCAGCGKLLWSGKGSLPAGQARCRECRRANYVPYNKPVRTKLCPECNQEFDLRRSRQSAKHGFQLSPNQTYCSPACANKAGQRARRRTPLSGLCKQCGIEFALRPRYNKQVYCSTACAVEATRKHPKRWPSSSIHIFRCAQCAKLVVLRKPRGGWAKRQKVCGPECRRLYHNRRHVEKYRDDLEFRDRVLTRSHEHRAHALGVGDARVTLAYLIERDGGRCRASVCHFRSRKVMALGTRGPKQPSMDHIIPLSRGGTHVLSNVHLTHYRCNLSKNNRGGYEQLRLIG